MIRRFGSLAAAVVLVLLAAWPGAPPAAVASNHFSLESDVRYDLRPDRRVIGVRVQMVFTNTTPDPAGQFSVFNDIRLAVHDEGTGFAASDDDGDLEVTDGFRGTGANRVHVATVSLREPLRFEESVSVELTYRLPDTEESRLRVRPSLVIFPAWSFGTSSEVSVTVPDGYEMRVDGDPLEEDGDVLVSGPIDDPTAWLSLVTAVRPTEQSVHEATVPLEGGTADIVVRAFGDDEAWGERTLALLSDALPLIEAEIGLPYPIRGQLAITESVAADASGFGESGAAGTEIAISFEQPPFTALHQVTHAWMPDGLVGARWIAEGIASRVAASVAGELDVDPPYDPEAEAEAHADAAFPLDAWPSNGDPEQQSYGYAASWAFIEALEAAAGPEAVRSVLGRVSASVGPYEGSELDPAPQNGAEPLVPLTSRSFLDQLEAVTDADVAPLFAERVFTEEDVALLEPRAAARAEFDALLADADGWGAPDPVRVAMGEWRFDEAMDGIAAAREWLTERDAFLERLAAAGLSAPDRLHQAYRAYGGGGEAEAELRAEGDLVDAYVESAARVNAPRSFLARLGLVGGPDPAAQLVVANGQFTDGDLNLAMDAIEEAERIVAAAETGGIVRVVSLALVVLLLVALAVIVFRRRASYTRGA